jgi:lipopolysaccharide/colanic/teichoic acid biosynthesis glycosyltransferase
MVVIRLESKGCPLFIQARLGRQQKPFRLLTLRTMAACAGDVPSHEISYDQITRTGAVLRRLKLDELPQLLNVLAGSMALVGPRPCLPHQSELIDERDRYDLFSMLPGSDGSGIARATGGRLF